MTRKGRRTPRPSGPVQVTRTVLPPLEDYLACVRRIFETHGLTNMGEYAQRLEKELAAVLDAPAIAVCANGTLALQLALRLLGLNGKTVITTPFTYVATLSALLWESCTPVFADIDPESLCMSPADTARQLEAHPEAAGILPVHVYGNACDVAALGNLAAERGIPVLYDAAHAFGSRLDGKSLFAYGDAATASFHATKLFHTVEGGCVVAHAPDAKGKLELLRAFGHRGDTHTSLGINAKLSELHAAMGLCLLPGLAENIARRTRLTDIYDAALSIGPDGAPGRAGLRRPRLAPGLFWNHSYYPVIFPDGATRARVTAALNARDIHPRRYFSPSLTRLPYVQAPPCPVSEDMAERVLCLPLWADMAPELADEIADLTLAAARG
ncbi:MAG: DegT/DnrJ/EryC1/StrS family aminotransferase [Desulfovibrio sp.]|nr:DegT/DnrJ/EryC1/StrS family aminotransferase [Desulfovibrio sp.]